MPSSTDDLDPPAKLQSRITVKPLSDWHYSAIAILYLGIYLFFDKVTAFLDSELQLSPWFLPAGLTVALLMWGGVRYAPVVAIAPTLSNVLLSTRSVDVPVALAEGLIIALVYSAMAIVLTSVLRVDVELPRFRDRVWFVVAILMASLMASLSVSTLFLWTGYIERGSVQAAIKTIWLGDVSGILLVSPILLTVAAPWFRLDLRHIRERARRGMQDSGDNALSGAKRLGFIISIETLGIILLLWLAFMPRFYARIVISTLLAVPAIVLAFQFGAPGALVGVLISNLAAVVGSATHGLPLAGFFPLQFHLLTAAVGGLLIGGIVSDGWRSHEAYTTLVDRSLQGMSIFQDGRIVFANSAVASIFGYSIEELRALSAEQVMARIHEDDRGMFLHGIADCPSMDPPQESYEARFFHKTGKTLWLELRVNKIMYQGRPAFQAIAIDVTDRVETQEIVQESEERYRKIIEASQDGIALTDESGKIIEWNPAEEEISGLSRLEVLGRPIWEVIQQIAPEGNRGEAALQDLRERIKERLQNPDSLHSERWLRRRIQRSDGTVRTLDQFLFDFETRSGRVAGVVSRDITEADMMQTTLQMSERRLKDLADSISDPFIALDGDLRNTYWNSASERITGIASEEALGKHFLDLFPQLRGTIVEQTFEEVIETQGTRSFQYTISMQGERSTFNLRAYPSGDGLAVIAEDITEQVRAEAALDNARSYIDQLLATANVIIVQLDLAGNITLINEMAEDLTGYSKHEMMGKNWFELLVPRDRFPGIWEDYARLSKGELPSSYENPILTKSGKVRIISWRNSVIHEDGIVIGAMAFGVDITDIRQSEQAQKRMARRLAALHSLDQSLLKTQTPRAIAQAAIDILKDLVPLERASVVTFDMQSGEATPLAILGEDIVGGSSQASHRKEMLSIIGKLRHGQAIHVPDLDLEESSSHMSKILRAAGIKDYLITPVMIRDELLATLNIGSSVANTFESETVEIAAQVAGPLAIALQQARMFEQADLARQRLRQLTRKLVNVQEEERLRVSRELHDEAGQGLTALKLHLQLILDELPEDSQHLTIELSQALELADTLMDRMRSLAKDLRPPVLDALGLNLALGELCKSFAASTQLSIDYRGQEATSLDDAAKIAIYRILQEALNNITKHAQARSVKIRMVHEDNGLKLVVSDDGKGWDPSRGLAGEAGKLGMGILGMQERLADIGGSLEIESQAGIGSTIIAHVPLELNG